MTTSTLKARFWAKVHVTPGCWFWTGSLGSHGYGQLRVGRSTGLAHRVSYELLVGPIAEGLQVDHLCRVLRCVNPAHLEAVTPRTNVLRSPSAPTAVNARKTQCIRGHDFDGIDCRGHRFCRECQRQWQRDKRATQAGVL